MALRRQGCARATPLRLAPAFVVATLIPTIKTAVLPVTSWTCWLIPGVIAGNQKCQDQIRPECQRSIDAEPSGMS